VEGALLLRRLPLCGFSQQWHDLNLMTPSERIRAALLQPKTKPPVAEHTSPQQPERIEPTLSSITVSEENLAALLRSVTTSSQ
jgi:hypothetical protein